MILHLTSRAFITSFFFLACFSDVYCIEERISCYCFDIAVSERTGLLESIVRDGGS